MKSGGGLQACTPVAERVDPRHAQALRCIADWVGSVAGGSGFAGGRAACIGDAIASADDAFGVSVGRESIGLYSATDVRGFSAIEAGNVRFDGVYVDPATQPSQRLLRTTNIRAGVSAQGFAFPAPRVLGGLSLPGLYRPENFLLFLTATSRFGVVPDTPGWANIIPTRLFGSLLSISIKTGKYFPVHILPA